MTTHPKKEGASAGFVRLDKVIETIENWPKPIGERKSLCTAMGMLVAAPAPADAGMRSVLADDPNSASGKRLESARKRMTGMADIDGWVIIHGAEDVIECAALAMEETMFASHELPCDAELHEKYRGSMRHVLSKIGYLAAVEEGES